MYFEKASLVYSLFYCIQGCLVRYQYSTRGLPGVRREEGRRGRYVVRQTVAVVMLAVRVVRTSGNLGRRKPGKEPEAKV